MKRKAGPVMTIEDKGQAGPSPMDLLIDMENMAGGFTAGRIDKLSARVAKRCLSADANMAYDAKNKRIRSLLRDLDKQLYKHEARQGTRMQDWTFVDDLKHVEEELTELLRFIGGGNRG